MPPKVVLSSDDVVDVSNDEPTDNVPSVIGEMRKPPVLGRLARVIFGSAAKIQSHLKINSSTKTISIFVVDHDQTNE